MAAKFEREFRAKSIIEVFEAKGWKVTPTVAAGLSQVKDAEKLKHLTRQAVLCENLDAFEKALLEQLPKPGPAATRGKRRSRKSES